LKAHPLPGDKASYGNFERLAQQNQEVIRAILETETSPSDSYDKALLKKLREFYTSCHNENELDQIGTGPLRHFVKTVRNLYQGKSLEISEEDAGDKAKGLTAAVAFLHSRGQCILRERSFVNCECRYRGFVLFQHRGGCWQ